jgi:2-keto-4-pentenoate hydratase
MPDISIEVGAALRANLEVPPMHERVGWKLAYGLGSLPPLIGPLTTRSLLRDGNSFEAVGARDLRVDTELALVVDEGLQVAGVAVALEVVDVTESNASLEQAIASGLTHRAVAFGPILASTSPIGRAKGVVDGEIRCEHEVDINPARSLALAADLLDAGGQELLPGDWLITGSQTQIPVTAGDCVEAVIDGLGGVTVSIR